jgi:hypothetical protein
MYHVEEDKLQCTMFPICIEIFPCIVCFVPLQFLQPTMSQFAFSREMNSVRMDEPITKGPIPRWQRKCIEASSLRFVFCNIKSERIERDL